MKINFKARQLVRSAHRGYLSTEFDSKNFKNIKTQMNKPFSYSTFTLAAFDYDLSPILLLSDLSEHTKNVQEKNSVSLMLCEERKLYKFFPKFDKAYWAERKAKEKLERDYIDYDSEILESVIKQILDDWENKRVDAASKGTILHEKIEDFYNSKLHKE